jgi:hypothetical protein
MMYCGAVSRLRQVRLRAESADRTELKRTSPGHPSATDRQSLLGLTRIRSSHTIECGIRSQEDACREGRSGAALVEFAIVAPVIFLLVLGLIQFAGLLMNQNVLTAAVREGGRTASLPTCVSADTVVASITDRVRRGGIDPALVTVTVTPTALVDTRTGDDLLVTVSAPMRELAWTWVVIPPAATMSAEAEYQRE